MTTCGQRRAARNRNFVYLSHPLQDVADNTAEDATKDTSEQAVEDVEVEGTDDHLGSESTSGDLGEDTRDDGLEAGNVQAAEDTAERAVKETLESAEVESTHEALSGKSTSGDTLEKRLKDGLKAKRLSVGEDTRKGASKETLDGVHVESTDDHLGSEGTGRDLGEDALDDGLKAGKLNIAQDTAKGAGKEALDDGELETVQEHLGSKGTGLDLREDTLKGVLEVAKAAGLQASRRLDGVASGVKGAVNAILNEVVNLADLDLLSIKLVVNGLEEAGELRDVSLAGSTLEAVDQAVNTAEGAVEFASSTLKDVGTRDGGGRNSASEGEGSDNSSELHGFGSVRTMQNE